MASLSELGKALVIISAARRWTLTRGAEGVLTAVL